MFPKPLLGSFVAEAKEPVVTTDCLGLLGSFAARDALLTGWWPVRFPLESPWARSLYPLGRERFLRPPGGELTRVSKLPRRALQRGKRGRASQAHVAQGFAECHRTSNPVFLGANDNDEGQGRAGPIPLYAPHNWWRMSDFSLGTAAGAI
jgi:hypothetical protein